MSQTGLVYKAPKKPEFALFQGNLPLQMIVLVTGTKTMVEYSKGVLGITGRDIQALCIAYNCSYSDSECLISEWFRVMELFCFTGNRNIQWIIDRFDSLIERGYFVKIDNKRFFLSVKALNLYLSYYEWITDYYGPTGRARLYGRRIRKSELKSRKKK